MNRPTVIQIILYGLLFCLLINSVTASLNQSSLPGEKQSESISSKVISIIPQKDKVLSEHPPSTRVLSSPVRSGTDILVKTTSSTISPAIVWQKCLGGSQDDEAYSIQQTSDGGYILSGYTLSSSTYAKDGNVSYNHGSSDVWVVKLTSYGTIDWEKSFGGSDSEGASDIIQTSDGGFIFAGSTESNNGNVLGNHDLTGTTSDYWVAKLDSSGNLIWQKCLGGSSSEGAECIQQTKDGGYILSGYTYSNDGNVSGKHDPTGLTMDYWVVKLDSSGNQMWQSCLGGSGDDRGNKIIQTTDGGYLVNGYTKSNDGNVTAKHNPSTDITDYWVAKLDSSGNLAWQKCLGSDWYDYGTSVEHTENGYVILGSVGYKGGNVTEFHGGESDYWIGGLDLSGNLLWENSLGGTSVEDGNDVCVRTIGGSGFIIGGTSWSNDVNVTNNYGYSDFWVVDLISTGEQYWQKSFGGTSWDYAHSINQTSDGGCVLAGFTQSNDINVSGNHGKKDCWIVKIQGPPIISAILPNSGTNTGSITTTIQGQNFFSDATIELKRPGYDSIRATDVSISSKAITCTFRITGAASGSWNLEVTNTDGQSGILSDGFTVQSTPLPAELTVTSILPQSGPNNALLSTTITGTNFQEGVSAKLVMGSSIITGRVSLISSSQFTASFPLLAASSGLYDLIVSNSDGTSVTKTGYFTVTSEKYIFYKKWGKKGSGKSQFKTPKGIAVDKKGNVYVADTGNNRIQKFNSNGKFLKKWGSKGNKNGQFSSPGDLAIDKKGNVYIVDTGNNRIQKFNSNGKFLKRWGSKGNKNGQFNSPAGLGIDSAGNVYVADTGNNRIQKFNSNGKFLKKWGSKGNKNGKFSNPRDVAVDHNGALYVADTGNYRIQKLSASGLYLTKWGGKGTTKGKFRAPGGIVVDANNWVFIADTNNDQIQKFTNTGLFMTKWGSKGKNNNMFRTPGNIAVNSGGTVFIVDTGNNRVSSFKNSVVSTSMESTDDVIKTASLSPIMKSFNAPSVAGPVSAIPQVRIPVQSGISQVSSHPVVLGGGK